MTPLFSREQVLDHGAGGAAQCAGGEQCSYQHGTRQPAGRCCECGGTGDDGAPDDDGRTDLCNLHAGRFQEMNGFLESGTVLYCIDFLGGPGRDVLHPFDGGVPALDREGRCLFSAFVELT